MNKGLRHLSTVLVTGLALIALVFGQPAATLTDIVAFVGNEVVDLTWLPISCERYEITRNGGLSGCTPESGVVTGKIYCRDTGLTDGETYTYKVEAITGEERTLIGEKSVTTGFVQGTLHQSLAWTKPGKTYSLDGRVLVTNDAVLSLGADVHLDKVSSPSEAAGIETEGAGGLQVTSGAPPASFTDIYLRLGADQEYISGQDGNLVTLTNVSMHLTHAALVNYCAFAGGSIEIVEVGGVPSLTSSRFANVPIWVSATSSAVVFDNDRFGDPTLGDFWVHDGGQVMISNSLFTANNGIGVEVGTNSVATISGNTFDITNSTGVIVWPGVGAEVTISDNVFVNAYEFFGMQAIFGYGGRRHEHELTGTTSSILAEDNIFTGNMDAVLLFGDLIDLEVRNNTIMDVSLGFRIVAGDDLGSVKIHENCIVAREGVYLNVTSDRLVDATGNWWGSASGPRTSHYPDATGSEIDAEDGNIDSSGWLQKENCAISLRNLTVTDMEAVQVVQTWDNQVPLVAGLPTAVRVYPSSNVGDLPDLSGELTVIRDGTQMGTLRPMAPMTAWYLGGLSAVNQLERRSDRNRSLIFKVPGAWVGGVMTFTVEVNDDYAIEEHDHTDNVISRGYTTVQRPPVRLGIVPTNHNWDTAELALATAPALDSMLALSDIFQKIYPSSEIDVTLLPTLNWPHLLNNHGMYPKYQYTLGAYYNTVGLSQMRLAAEGGVTGPAPDLVYGAFPAEDWYLTFYDSFGESLTTSRAAVSLGKSTAQLFTYQQLSLLGVWGTPTLQSLDDVACNFYDVGYDLAQDRVVGYGHDTCSVLSSDYPDDLDPNRYWITLEHYQRLLAASAASAPSAVAGVTAEQDYVGVLANISGEDEVELLPSWQFTTETPPHNPPVGNGTYCVELRDVGEATLSSQCFDLLVTPGNAGWDHVLVALPLTGAPARVVVLREGTEIAEIPVTAHDPVVTVTGSSQALGNTLTADAILPLSWTATDSDAGDELEYSILVSSDNGATWLPVAANLDVTTFDLDLSEIPAGEQVWVRIEASDGFNVGSADYGPFSLANHTPEVVIHAPASGAAISATQSLAGFAYDREDGQLGGTALSWTSSIDGELGTGATVFPSLSEGRHTLTLAATDSAGTTGTASVSVTVGDVVWHRIYLPLVLRNFP